MIIVQLSPSVTHTTHRIYRDHSSFNMAEGGASEGLHWLNAPFCWFQLEWMLLKLEPILNHLLYLELVIVCTIRKNS